MTSMFTIEARSYDILGAGVASHNYWILRDSFGNKIAELHGFATDRSSGNPVAIGTTDKESLRGWSFIDEGWEAVIGASSSSPYFRQSYLYDSGQQNKVVFSGSAEDVFS
ncbi:hypothetical protein [Pseudomonas sp. GV071]|uniref:hypothetical protein n=1 Tax=Pseudomonas sp. GV071 TaxID=2135754 RepID=UPI0011B26E62|nr:hypothetical protein [Pseudomonas sp. GV071]